MARYRNSATGVVIDIPEEKAGSHASGYEAVGESSSGDEPQPKRRGRPPKASTEDS